MFLESYVVDIVEGRRKPHLFLEPLLFFLSKIMEISVRLRHFLFDHSIKKRVRVDVPVVSIGNIVAGGTGKTPFLQKLGQDLASKGKIAILSRGYRSKMERKGGELHSISPQELEPRACGDEPYLLFQALPKAAFFIGKNRVANAKKAVFQSAQLIFLDDGMQYLRLYRDIEIVMLNVQHPYGRGSFLPRGYLRDFPERLRKANYLVAHGIDHPSQYEKMKQKVLPYSQAPLIGTKMIARGVYLANGEKWDTLQGKRVALFCGLGSPESFARTVREFGGKVQSQLRLLDHTAPTKKALQRFCSLSQKKGCDLLLCSEKDWVKLPTPPTSLSLPLGYLKGEITVVEGKKVYQKLLHTLKNYLKEQRKAYEAVD